MRKVLGLFSVVVLCLVLVPAAFAQNGANKVHTSGSVLQFFAPTVPATILSTQVKTSTNADLLLSVSAECAVSIADSETTVRNNTATSFSGFGGSSSSTVSTSDFGLAQVRVWVTVDGAPVPVANETFDVGRVVFCRREKSDFNTSFTSLSHSSSASFSSVSLSEQHSTAEFEATRTANAFNWRAQNVGNGVHTVEVRAQILHATASSSFSSFNSFASNPAPVVQGVVGRRSLVVEAVLPSK